MTTTIDNLDHEYVAELAAQGERRAFAAAAVAKVLAAAQRMLAERRGCYGSRKVYLSALASELGQGTGRLASLLATWQAAGLLPAGCELSRADLIGAMDADLVKASEVVMPYGTGESRAEWHFLAVG